MIGKTILYYEILEKLGEGGMGVVYKAHDTKLDRIVALKFLTQHVSGNEQEQARFLQEAKSASALNHPNVCTIFDIKEDGDQQFIVMEFVDGVTLREKVSPGSDGTSSLTIKDAMSYAIQIGEALQEAHTKGIVHRDVKTENIMVNSKNQVKVMDFGLAKLKGSLKLTRTSSTVGTLAYMAPEQIQGGAIDARSDIFSFGVVLFEMLTGRTPFRGEHEGALVYSIVNEEPESVQKYRPDASPEIIHVLTSALEKDPEERYQAVSEMVRDLRRAQKQSASLSRSYSTEEFGIRSGLRTPAPVSPEPSSPAVASKSGSRKTYLIAGLVVLAVIIYGGYEFLFKGQSAGESSSSFQSMKITRLTSTGKTRTAAMSPDGKYVVYSEADGGKQSLWVRQVATGSNVQIVPPADVQYSGLTMSRDGNYIYYVASPQESRIFAAYQIPVLGGTPKRLIEDVDGPITISPDGKQFAFNRYYSSTGDFAIMVAHMDGTGERRLASHKGDLWFEGGVSWSPDGKVIAAGLGSWEGGLHFNVVLVSADDGRETRLGSHQWFQINSIAWLNDGTGLMVTGSEKGSTTRQIWQVMVPTGEGKRVTNDLNDYANVTLTGDSQTLSVVQSDVQSAVWIYPSGDNNAGRKVTTGKNEGQGGVCWTPGNRLVYSSLTSGNYDLWSMDAQGKGQTQLTADPAEDWMPAVSPDGKRIFLTSTRSGIPNIWCIDIDGSRPRQITSGGEDYDPSVSADGKWVLFQSWDTGPLLATKVPVEGGDPVPLTHKTSWDPVNSPDGKYVAFAASGDKPGDQNILVVPLLGGEPVLTTPVLVRASLILRWSRDGSGLYFTDRINGVDNIFFQPLKGGAPEQFTHFTSDFISAFDWSWDGKELAVSRMTVSTDVILISGFR